MRALLIATLFALVPVAASTVAAQEARRPQVIFVAGEPDFRLSVGTAQPVSEVRLTVRARMELQPDCTWAAAADITVPSESIVTSRDPAAVGGAERFGTLYATTYSSLVAYQGGSPNLEYHGCVRQRMTERASGQ
jgi:hypothetical protein